MPPASSLFPEQWARAFAVAEIGRWTWSAETDLFTDDAIAQRAVGWPSHQRSRTDYVQTIASSDRDVWKAQWNDACDATASGTFACVYRLILPADGSTRWLAEAGQMAFRDGTPIQAVGTVRDITAWWQQTTTTDAAVGLLAGIVSISTDAIISMDDRQIISMFNSGAESIFGYARDEVVGQPLTILLPEAFRAAHDGHVRGFATASTPARRMGERSEILGRRKSGETFPAEASISKVDVGGRRIYTAVLRDITERKQSEELLQRRVDEATQELRLEMKRREESQALLVRTQRMEAFGQLTGGIAHDFNNLLTVIMGNLELLDMRLTDEKSKVLMQRAQDAAGMGARLTARLLTFARRRRFEALPLNVNELVIDMAELLERTLGEQITLTTSLEREPWTILADASEVENAVLNLAINARDAMPQGGKLIIETANISFETARSDIGGHVEAGDYVRLAVTDTGTGMPPHVLRQAFEPFFTTKDSGKGTGLGLSSIYGFVQQSKGTISIYSEVGTGTSVSLYLPRAETPSVAAATTSLDEATPSGRGEHILVVEDNAEVRAVTIAQLEALGYAVSAVATGPEALRALANGTAYDLVFSDVVMPGGMSGFDVVRWVTTNHPSLKVLLTSGYPDGVLDQTASARAEILRKPFSRAELARAMRRALGA